MEESSNFFENNLYTFLSTVSFRMVVICKGNKIHQYGSGIEMEEDQIELEKDEQIIRVNTEYNSNFYFTSKGRIFSNGKKKKMKKKKKNFSFFYNF